MCSDSHDVTDLCAQSTMTSVDHDDSIEIISFQADSTPVTDGDCTFVDNDSTLHQSEDFIFQVLPTTAAPKRKKSIKNVQKEDPKQKRIKGAVMVIASLLIMMSLILVGVTLSMSDHIDEMVRQKHHMSTTTPRPTPVTRIRVTAERASNQTYAR